MNIREQIIADITAKVEAKLANQKVELSIKDDINNVVSDYETSRKKVDNTINKFYDELFSAKKTYQSAKADIEMFLSLQKQLNVQKDKALSMGKELGIDVTSAPFYKDLLSALSRFDDMNAEVKLSESIYKNINI